MSDVGRSRTITKVWKFIDRDGKIYEMLRSGASIEEVLAKYGKDLTGFEEVKGNIFLTEGVNFIWVCLSQGSCSPPFNNSNSYIGVGDGDQEANASQTGLQGTNKYYKRVDSGYPTVSGNKITFRATFGSDEANFSWKEWTVANGASDNAVNINRKVKYLGDKESGSTWVLMVELSIT